MGLATQGYAILEAPNGRDGPGGARAREVDLVILDLGLPDMRGHDLLRAIRASHPGLPVVVLSSRDDEAGKVEALDLGADDYVTKPFGMAELLARLRAALRHQLAARGERPVFRVDGLSVDLVRRHRQGRRRRGEADPARVRLPAGAGAACRQGADPRAAAARGLGRPPTRSTCGSTCASSGRSWRPIPSGPASFSPRPASATAYAPPTTDRTSSRGRPTTPSRP